MYTCGATQTLQITIIGFMNYDGGATDVGGGSMNIIGGAIV